MNHRAKITPKITSCCICILLWANFAKAQNDFAREREHMVNAQIKARGVYDYATLRAMLLVPRHEFDPDRIKSAAYSDHALPIGNGQTISQPYIVA
ncbi:MAG: hypothetical protein KJN65_13115, partial [Croceitalea sp.]|nr:hypothetical protein [Croceitalea sp.]